MLGVLSSSDSKFTNKNTHFVHIISSDDSSIEVEVKPRALALARQLNLKKVFLLYGEKGKIIYDFSV